MSKAVPSAESLNVEHFDPHAVSIAMRQYLQPKDNDLSGVFKRVATWVASPEQGDEKAYYTNAFFQLMASKRFCPGGRVLAGAATSHGNVLNCFVQDGQPEAEGSNGWVLNLATKLALVTKVGGGNGLCLDPITPKRVYSGPAGNLFLTVSPNHPDYQKVKSGTFFDLVHGEYHTQGYRYLSFLDQAQVPSSLKSISVRDSVGSIWNSAGEAVTSILAGEDVILDVSELRAEGTPVQGSGGTSSGPSSFAVEVFDNFGYWASLGAAEYAGPVATLRHIFAPTLRVIRQGGTRRGAGMATMSITNPDLQDFITAKDLDREQQEGDISTFNISVLVSDDFMKENIADVRQGVLWDIANHAWQTGEPGLIYIDRINEHNPMRAAMGDICSTNPCGEIPLYPGEPCDLGAMNLAAYVLESDAGLEGFDFNSFYSDVKTCTRFLDNVLDVNAFALEDNKEMSMSLRRLGLGVMGLADALIKMGFAYNSEEGRAACTSLIAALRDSATEASEELAGERGSFPRIAESALEEPRRNIAVLTVAPTGTTSMLMGVSSGVEPVFAPFIYRKIGDEYNALIHPLFKQLLEEYPPHREYALEGNWNWEKVVEAVQNNHGSVQGLNFVPDAVKTVLICAHDISPEDHVLMQGAVQTTFDGGKKVANSISKTINMPNDATVDDVYNAYSLAYKSGCKGITVYRDGSRQYQVLSTKAKPKEDKVDEVKDQEQVSFGGTERLPGEPLFDRPGRLTGFTDQVKLTDLHGQKRGFYVTVNQQDDLPTEVFISSGKAGDEANADSEALGRVVSIALQYGVPGEALVTTLRGINGGMYGTYQGRTVASKADLIAVALETSGVENILNRGKGCPDCGSPLRFEEGCQKCEGCGYSKCG